MEYRVQRRAQRQQRNTEEHHEIERRPAGEAPAGDVEPHDPGRFPEWSHGAGDGILRRPKMKPSIVDHTELDVVWETCDRPGWDRLASQAGRSSLEQSWVYGEAVAATANVQVERAVVYRGGEPAAIVQAFTRRLAGLGRLVRITRGPLWLHREDSACDRHAVIAAIDATWRLGRRELAVWMPEIVVGPRSDDTMRRCGMRRMVTGYSSAWVDLARSEESLRKGLHGKWRNMLRAGERAGLAIEAATASGPELDWLMQRYASFRRARRFLGPEPGLIQAFAKLVGRRGDVLVMRALADRSPVAGLLLLRHGASATYYVGWTSDEGRRCRAHNLLLWRGMLELRDDGVSWLDLGGINATSAPGVARFKLGVGGEVFTLAGTYI